jgi:hypothetical protein
MGPTPMMQLEIWMTIAGRVLVAAIFLLNAFGSFTDPFLLSRW